MGRCDKIVVGPAERDRMSGKGFCCKPGKGEITWRFRHNNIQYYYCEEHLDKQIRRTFKNGKVNLLMPGRTIITYEIESLIKSRACISKPSTI